MFSYYIHRSATKLDIRWLTNDYKTIKEYKKELFILVIRMISSHALQSTTLQGKHVVVCLDGVVAEKCEYSLNGFSNNR
jgi:hypothetical protein